MGWLMITWKLARGLPVVYIFSNDLSKLIFKSWNSDLRIFLWNVGNGLVYDE